MPIDAAIPLQVQPPPSPLGTIGQLMNIRDTASQVALRNSQQQEFQAQADQRKLDLADQNTIQEAMRDPAVTEKIYAGDVSSLAGKVQPKTLNTIVEGAANLKKSLLANTAAQNALTESAYQKLNDSATSLLQLKKPDGTLDLDAINQHIPSLKQNLASEGVFKQANIDQGQFPDAITDPNQLIGFQATLHGILSSQKQVSELQKTEAATAESAAKARESTANATKQEMVNDAMKKALADPTSGATLIDQAIPPNLDPQINSSYKAAWQAAMSSGDFQAAAHVVTAAAGHASTIALATNPIMRQGEAATAGARAQAEVPAHVSAAVQSEMATAPLKMNIAIATAKALRQGDNPAVAGVAPAAVVQVQNQAIKLDESYAKAKAAADSIQQVLSMAGAGNKAAGASVPLVGVGAINAINNIKRSNSADISRYGTAGSLLDKIQGQLQGWTEGQPIPADVLKNMQELHSNLANEPWRVYIDSLNSLNSRTNAKFPPNFDPPSASQVLPTGHKVGDTVTVRGGKKVTITAVHPDGTFDAK